MVVPDDPRMGDSSRRISPALRLLTDRAHATTRRPVVVAGGLLARLGLIRAISVWPDLTAPSLALEPGRPETAAWMRHNLLPGQRSEGLIPAAIWQAGRARGLLVGESSGLAVRAAQHALGRTLADPTTVLLSPAGCANKATGFVVERGSVMPSAVVKIMTDRRREAWLRDEMALVEALRSLLDGDGIGRALAPPALFAGTFAGDYVVVEPFDPVATGTAHAQRAASVDWLMAFRRATATGREPWSEADARQSIETVERTWGRLRPWAKGAVVADVSERMTRLIGVPVLRCACHGDFARGNVAQRDGELRILDWEWGALSGDPFLDLWTYELGELREGLTTGVADARAELEEAASRVAEHLVEEDMDPGFALATLAPCAGRLVTRIRDVTNSPSGWEAIGDALLCGVEELLSDSPLAPVEPRIS